MKFWIIVLAVVLSIVARIQQQKKLMLRCKFCRAPLRDGFAPICQRCGHTQTWATMS